MKRRFLLPALIAVALHASLLLFPRGAPRMAEVVNATSWELMPVTLIEEAIPDPALDVSLDPAPARPRPPGNAEPVRVDNDLDFAISVDVPPVRLAAPGPFLAGPVSLGSVPGGTGVGRGILDASALDNVPRALVQARPDYPLVARRAAQEGEVTVEFVVDTTGAVRQARVARSTDRLFEAAALRAVEKWRFEAGRRHGQKVPFRMSVPIQFRIGD